MSVCHCLGPEDVQKMSNKLITVIVPSYNMEGYLPKCLGSLIIPDEALLQRLDVIVVNDGSKDRTSEIAHQFEKDYPGVFRVIDKGNGNYGSCINAALPLVSGSYVKILDADDTVESKAFVRYLSTLAGIPERERPDVFINDFVEVDLSGAEILCRSFGAPGNTAFSLSSLDPLNGRTLWMHAIAYRTNILREGHYRQLEGISYTDQEWAIIPLMSAKSFQRFPEPVYRYLLGRPGQTMDPAVRLRNFAQHLPVLESIIRAYLQKRHALDAGCELYVRDYILANLLWIYREYLVRHPFCLNEAEIADFDFMLKNADYALFSRLEEDFVAFTKWRIRFHYVKEWRNHASRRSAKFRLFDCAMRLRETWHRMKCDTQCPVGRAEV